MLFQFGALFTDLSVHDNVAFPLREMTDLPESMIHDIVLMKLDTVGLRDAAAGGDVLGDRYPRCLGSRRRAHRHRRRPT